MSLSLLLSFLFIALAIINFAYFKKMSSFIELWKNDSSAVIKYSLPPEKKVVGWSFFDSIALIKHMFLMSKDCHVGADTRKEAKMASYYFSISIVLFTISIVLFFDIRGAR